MADWLGLPVLDKLLICLVFAYLGILCLRILILSASNTEGCSFCRALREGNLWNRNQNFRGNKPLTCSYVRSGFSSHLLCSTSKVTVKNKIVGGKRFPALIFLLSSSSAQYFVVCAFVGIKCVSPNNVVLLLLILQWTRVGLCCCLSLWQQSIKSWTGDCDLSAKSRGRDATLQKGTVLTRHKSPAVLAEKLNSIGQVNGFLYKYSVFQIRDDRKIFLHLTSPLVQLFCEKYQTLEQGKQCFVFNDKNMNRGCSDSHISLSSSTLTWVNISLGQVQRHSGLHNWTILALYYYWHVLLCFQEQ